MNNTRSFKPASCLEAAQADSKRGIWCVPIPFKEKGPRNEGWQNHRISEAELPKYFNSKPQNIGRILDDKADSEFDLDLDCPEALAAAEFFLPRTGEIHGRKSSPRSHWWFRCVGNLPRYKKFTDIDGKECLLEIRTGPGKQTVIPPSVHESGEPLEWEFYGEPAEVTAEDISRYAAYLAVVALLARRWPRKKGSRQDIAMALGGFLLRGGLPKEDTCAIVGYTAKIAGDEEWEKRAGTVIDTVKKIQSNKPVTGGPKLAQLLPDGDKILKKLSEWLNLKNQNHSNVQTGGVKSLADKETGKRPPQSVVLIELTKDAELWHTQERESYVTISAKEHREHWPIRSKNFRDWLKCGFYKGNGQPPCAQALQDAIGLLEARAIQDGPEQTVFLRLAESGGIIYLDLCNPDWEVVEITPSGWQVVKNPPVHFRRTRGMGKLPHPIREGSIEELRPFVNVKENRDWVLLVSWLVGALRPRGPYPIAILEGEQGSAKSTTARVVRELIDSSAAPLRTLHRDQRDLMIAANNGWVIAFDNLSGLPWWMSDALARLATGGGLSTRELYSDKEETLFDAQRPIILNGIDQIASRGDLLDRAIRLNLPSISEESRKEEATFWEEFEHARPRILGALLSAVSTALKRIPEVHLERLPRMADFAKWVAAAEPAFGWPVSTFMEAYTGNRRDAVALGLEDDPVASLVIDLLSKETNHSWKGTATELLKKLGEMIDETTKRGRWWPQTATVLSNRLRRAAPLLRGQGIEIVRDRQGGTGTRILVIRRMSEKSVTDRHPVTDPELTPPGGCDDDSTPILHSATESSHPSPLIDGVCDTVTQRDDGMTAEPNHKVNVEEAKKIFEIFPQKNPDGTVTLARRNQPTPEAFWAKMREEFAK